MSRLSLIPLLLLANAAAFAAEESAPAPAAVPEAGPRPALMARHLAQARMIDIANAGPALVAVGESGVILRSTDGQTWQQSPSPADVMLTRVRFADANHGWVLGYDASILQTVDGGKTWTLQHYDPKGRALYDLLFLNAQKGLAVGAYGQMLETQDGGKTWVAQDSPLTRLGVHLNVLLKLSDGSLFVAGERGLMARSRDEGASWQALNSPYAGSFFGAQEKGEKGLLLYGMRGNLFSTTDLNKAATLDIAKWDPDKRQTVTGAAQISALGWRRIENESHESLFGALPLKDGALVLVGVNGTALKLDAAGTTLTPIKTPAAETLVKLVAFNGRMIAVGRRMIQDIGAMP
jgi:photosystem II stability/assembly factor-like uncharacterized protein